MDARIKPMEGAGMPQAVFLKSRFDLTPAEARIVLRLVAGDSLQSAAKALGVTYGTVRTHLKAVFQKTGTCRQAELVIVVIRAMNGALWLRAVFRGSDAQRVSSRLRTKSTEALPRASPLSARAVLEKVWPAPSARAQHGFPALLKAVEAAIVCRRIVKGTPGARRSGARSAASDQEQEREADNRFSHWRFFRRSGGT
jgi:DNA-binding CsgD family transcriptional regulator